MASQVCDCGAASLNHNYTMDQLDSPFTRYLSRIERHLRRGVATEHTYRGSLERLVEEVAGGLQAINEPRRVACGAPDLRVVRDTTHGPITVGHIEAKDIGVALAEAERTDQLRRYKSALPNLILTDYLEFRWYVDGERRMVARLAEVADGGRLVPIQSGIEDLSALLNEFFAHNPEVVRSPRVLAERMAKLTHLVRDMVVAAIESGQASQLTTGMHEAFQEVLLPDLSIEQFADMYAQVISYGLFTARVYHRGTSRFTRADAAREIPRTNPFLRRLFGAIAGPELDDEPYVGFVDDLVQLLADADISRILRNFGGRARRKDPIVHFYETFLAAYDPALREARGVYYTPEPVVSYIVDSVDNILRQAFGCPEGLADEELVDLQVPVDDGEVEHRRLPRVLILDPACGTGTFLYAVVDRVRERFTTRGDAGMWSPFVRTQLLPRLFGFELLAAPYAVAHLKLGLQLRGSDLPAGEREHWAYDFQGDERLGVYLTNTLEEAFKRSELLIGRFISDEADAAAEVKRHLPIMVVLGNPPYSGHSANKGEYIRRLVEDYKRDYPDLNRPAQGKWLQDDYVKFIRFAQERIVRTGAGVLAFVTNNRYLRNRTFRGMRDQLMNAFSDIYILDLHGDSLRGETSPDGTPDQNVFDIQQGVSIGIFIKRPDTTGRARVRHADLWGTREAKYEWLDAHDLQTTPWTEVAAEAPLFLFVPRDEDIRSEYEAGWRLQDIMNQGGDPAPGIVTTHDQFAVAFTDREMKDRIRRFLLTRTEDEARGIWRLCTQAQWNYDRAKNALSQSDDWEDRVVPILYRPFDRRYTVYDPHVAVHRRERVMRHMLGGGNLGLVTTRSVEIGRGFEHVFATTDLIQHHTVSTKEVNYLFPLYLRPTEEEIRMGLYGPDELHANIAPDFVAAVENAVGLRFIPAGSGDLAETFGPDDVFHYIYALLYSTEYRERYSSFLEEDFPRIPITSNTELFKGLIRLGKELVDVHTGRACAIQSPVSFPVPGNNEVAPRHPRYVPADDHAGGRVYINQTQYFDGVPAEAWEFHIGGIQVAQKWLQDRRGRELGYSDLADYRSIVQALARSVEIIGEVDEFIESMGGWPLK